MAETAGCARVTGAVMSDQASSPTTPQCPGTPERKELVMIARVGQKAPDFAAPSYYKGGFTPVKLSDQHVRASGGK